MQMNVNVLTNVRIVPCTQSTLGEHVPVWFVLDEFGSSIQHSFQPSFAMVPFYYVPKQEAYSMIWPLKDVTYGGIASVHRHSRGYAHTCMQVHAQTHSHMHSYLCPHTLIHTYIHTHTFTYHHHHTHIHM